MVWRFGLVLMAALLVSVGAVTTIAHLAVHRNIEQNPPPLLNFLSEWVHGYLAAMPEADQEGMIRDMASRIESPARLVPMDDPSLPEDVRNEPGQPRTRMNYDGGKVGLLFYQSIPETGKTLVVGPLTRSFGPDLRDTALMLLIVVFITGVTAFFLAVPFVRRLKRLEHAAVLIGQGDLSARADVQSDDPIGSLASRFNEMADRNQRLMEDQRQILQAVAHELRTPTARIRFALEMLGSESDPDAIHRRLDAVDDDLSEVDDLVGELLQFLRYENGIPMSREQFDVAASLEDLAGRVRDQVNHLALVVDCPDALVVFAEPRAFRRAVRNLLENALRYARTRVEIRVAQVGDVVRISVCDDGPGIPEKDRKRILEPFARVDDSRSRGTGGVGLGLAIVARVLEANEGSLEVGECDLGGARFTMSWPAAS